ncbi:MAG TPA: TonB-dependent receptor [Candidatus Solibacter sp.]
MFLQRAVPILAAALLCCAANAQSTNASIYGSVTDSSGAVAPKANVTAANVKTGVSQSTVTNADGVYLFPSLQPGEYTVGAELTGFRKSVSSGIQLAVGARISVDIKLEIGVATETVTVAASSGVFEAVTSSVSNVVSQQRVQDLPLQSRDAGALIALQAGVVGDNFNGARSQSQNVTLDGVDIQEPRYNGGFASANLTTTNSVDRVGEFRVSTAPADAEFGRGLAQVQMIGRSGTNELHGSVFEFNRVTALSANDWFNNQLGRNADGSLVAPRNFLIRNQFGARVDAPIKKNKTFVFFLYEGQRQKTKSAVNTTVFTSTARQGLFRFYPGVRNGAATAAVPTVDLNGNPTAPAGATGPLQTVSLFGLDPNRPAADPTGNVAKALKDYPLPNNFLRGDGLNTAGFFWQQPGTADNDLYNGRLDHQLTANTRLAFSTQFERGNQLNGFQGQVYPLQPTDAAIPRTDFYSLTATTSIRPNLLNEFRAGVNRFRVVYDTPFSPGLNSVLPHIGSQPFYFTFTSVTNEYTANNAPQGRTSPVYQYSDRVNYLRWRHALKAGVEVRFDSSNGFNSFRVVPQADIGAGAVPYANINTITGIGNNSTAAQNMLGDLSGSLADWIQAFNSAGGKNPTYIPGEPVQRTWRQRSVGSYLQDDWKVSSKLTLNLGVRYDFYGVPYEANGKAVVPVGGTTGAFGLSGSSFADAFQPGHLAGSLTQLQLVGPGSPNAGKGLYNNDWNNFAPAIGVSYAPNLKTVLRAGYFIVYDRNSLRNADTEVGSNPGINSTLTFTSGNLMNLSNVGVPFGPAGLPLATVPVTDRLQTLRLYDTNLVTPYVQNWNISVQREIAKDSVLTVRYVGTKGTKMLSGVDINQGNILTNGFLDAFKVTRAGGNAPLFDQLFAGLTVPGKGVVDGVSVRGSDYARSNATFASYLADGRVGTFANNLNSSALLTNVNGGLLRHAGLPENFFFTNPQFATVNLVGNNANSTYHSLQAEFEKRFGHGWVYQGNYTFSKALGENEGTAQVYDTAYRNAQNLHADKRLMNFNRTHVFKSNGIWDLPVGRDKALLRNASRVVDGFLGGWKLSGILTFTSGRPITVTAPLATFNKYTTGQTPDVSGALPKNTGGLQFDGNGACYFCGFKQVADPNLKNIAPALAGISNLFAQQGPGGVMLTDPLPGTLGSLAQSFFTGPRFFNLDASLAKDFKLTERFRLNIRTDWINATNHEDFATATIDANINSATFGRVTAKSATGNNNRIVVLGARINF